MEEKKEIKEVKEIKVMKEDIDSFFQSVITFAIVQAAETITELIKAILEDNLNKKEENDKEIN